MRVSDVLLSYDHSLLCKVLVYVTKSRVAVGDGSLKLLAKPLDSPVHHQHPGLITHAKETITSIYLRSM